MSHNIHSIKADRDGLVGLAEVERVTRLSEATIRRRMRTGEFPPQLRGLTRAVWRVEDIETYLAWRCIEPWIPWTPPA